jgi:hypothetical protein
MPTIFRQRVNLNGVDFNVPGSAPLGALNWVIDVCDGWKDTPEPDFNSTPLAANRDGSSSADFAPYPARFVTIGGVVYAPDEATAEALEDYLLTTAMPRSVAFSMTRYESTPKVITCKRATKFETDWLMPNGFRWNTTLQADDPLKYSLNVTNQSGVPAGLFSSFRTYPRTYPLVYTASGAGSTSVGFVNAGSAASRSIVVTIGGPLTAGAWRLRNDTVNGELGFNIGLTATDTLTIDFSTEIALLNGYPVAYTLSGDFWALAPGSNTIRLYADYDPATDFTVAARSAWE